MKKSRARKVIRALMYGMWWVVKRTALLMYKIITTIFHFFVTQIRLRVTQIRKAQSAANHKSKQTSPAVHIPLKQVKTFKGELSLFENRLHTNSMILLIAGRRGSGKSALGFRLLENIHAATKRQCFALGPQQTVLPSWISAVSTLQEAANGSAILVDEAAISFSSRESLQKTNKQLSGLLAVARHKDISLIFVTQNTGMIDKNVLALCDALLLKEGSLLQERFERPALKEVYTLATAALSQIPEESRESHFYVLEGAYEGLCSAYLPSFWSDAISKNQK